MNEARMKVFIVDDEYSIVEWMQKSIDWELYDFEIVGYSTSAVEAYQYIMKHPVDLLLTDISMPEVSGLELIKFAKERWPQILVIVVSAYDKFPYVKEAFGYGIINYCLKPIDTSELLKCLHNARIAFNERQMKIYNNDIQTIRNSIFLKLLNGDGNVLKFEEQSRLAKVDFSAANWQVVLMDLNGLRESEMVMLLNYYRDNEHKGYYCFLDVDMNLVFLLYGEAVSKEAWRVRKILNGSIDRSDVFVCVGEPLNTYRQVPASYHRCLDFLNAAFLFHNRTVQVGKYFVKKYQYDELDNELSQLLNAFNVYSIYDMRSIIRKILQKCRNMSEERIECINLAIFLLKKTRGIHLDHNTEFQMECFEILDSSTKMMKWMDSFCARLVHEKEQMEGCLHPMVKYVLQEINSHYMDCTFSVNELAEKTGLSASYLGTLFKQQTGELIKDCLSRRRLEKAIELLGIRDLTMREIAATCGFESQNYLNRVFKQKYGLSLTEYRRMLIIEKA